MILPHVNLRKAAGLTLVEVLIALVLFSIALLGLDALNLASLRLAKSIWYYRAAELQAENMLEMLRANKGKLSASQLVEWNAQNRLLLPNGSGVVNGLQVVTIFWGNHQQAICKKSLLGINGCLVASLSSNYFSQSRLEC